jgi:hypothetical protein
MTTRAKDPTVAMRCPSPLVLFGIDNRGKPKAARFRKEHAGLAIKAATQLQLNVLASKDPKVAEIAARLPVGRIHATGRMFVPFVRHDLYEKLVAAAANGNPDPSSPPNGSSGASGSTPGGSAPHLHKPGNPLLSAISSLQTIAERMAGMRPLSSKQTATCSPYAGVITRGNVGLCGTGCGLECSIRDSSRKQRTGNRRKQQAGQSTTNRSPQNQSPTANRCPRTGPRSTSITSCWPKTTANGRPGGKPSRSRRMATYSSSAGARNMLPT